LELVVLASAVVSFDEAELAGMAAQQLCGQAPGQHLVDLAARQVRSFKL